MGDLLVIVPSRGRPQNVAALLESWADTTAGDTELWIVLDEDDPELKGYTQVLPEQWPNATLRPPRWIVQERLRLGGTLNAVASAAAAGGRFRAIGFMGDDHRPRTIGWDVELTVALGRLGTGLVYGNDLIQGAALPTAVAMTSDIVAALGYMVPPGMVHMYLDNVWLELGRRLGRLQYLSHVVIEHLHPIAGKAEWDDRYREVNSDAQFASDRAAFEDYVQHRLESDVVKVNEMIGMIGQRSGA